MEVERTALSCCAAASGSTETEKHFSVSTFILHFIYVFTLTLLTSVLTSRTDLKSLDMEASLDC